MFDLGVSAAVSVVAAEIELDRHARETMTPQQYEKHCSARKEAYRLSVERESKEDRGNSLNCGLAFVLGLIFGGA